MKITVLNDYKGYGSWRRNYYCSKLLTFQMGPMLSYGGGCT